MPKSGARDSASWLTFETSCSASQTCRSSWPSRPEAPEVANRLKNIGTGPDTTLPLQLLNCQTTRFPPIGAERPMPKKLAKRSKPQRQSKPLKRSAPPKHVYFFGKGKADGNRAMKGLLGGKGAGLAEMTNAGLPVPPGFTIST